MAGHAATGHAAELTDDPSDDADTQQPPSRPPTPIRRVAAFMLLASLVLAGLGSWFGYGEYQARQRQLEQARYVAIGRQAAANLTTINFNTVDADVTRILDSATGAFLDDFQKRAPDFIEVVKQAKSTSEGTVTEAGLESVDGEHGQVMVVVQVKTAIGGAPSDTPRRWRMRIDVEKTGNDLKVANVEFVP